MTLGSLSLIRVIKGLGSVDLIHNSAFMISLLLFVIYLICIWLGIKADHKKPKVNLQRPRTIPPTTNRMQAAHSFQEMHDSSYIFHEESKRPE